MTEPKGPSVAAWTRVIACVNDTTDGLHLVRLGMYFGRRYLGVNYELYQKNRLACRVVLNMAIPAFRGIGRSSLGQWVPGPEHYRDYSLSDALIWLANPNNQAYVNDVSGGVTRVYRAVVSDPAACLDFELVPVGHAVPASEEFKECAEALINMNYEV